MTFLITQFPLLNNTGSSSSDRDPPYPNLSCQYCTFKIPDSFKSKYLFCSFYRKDQCRLHSDQFPGHPDAVNSILSVSDNIVMTGWTVTRGRCTSTPTGPLAGTLT